MRSELPNLPSLLAFECAARHQSFAAAAIELNLAQSTVSHRVRLLENQLGTLLFERLPRNLKLTEAGKMYLPTVKKVFDELSISTAGLFGSNTKKSICVRSTISFGLLWLIPRLQLFRAEHENIIIQLQTSVWPDDLSKEQIDLEIRFGNGRWEGYEIEHIQHDQAILLCSPATENANGKIKDIHSLLDKHLIHIYSLEDLWIRLFMDNKLEFKRSENSVIVDSTIAALELASSNNMYVLAPELLVKNHIKEKKLIQAHPVKLAIKSAHYVLTPINSSPQTVEVGLFKSWMLSQLQSV